MRTCHLAGAAALLALAPLAGASVITARLDNVSPEVHMTATFDAGATSNTYYCGVNNFSVTGGDPTPLSPSFRAFCIDVHQVIHFNTDYTFTTAPVESAPIPGGGMGAAKADLLRELWGRYYMSISTNTQGAAFQAAVWEIVSDSGLDLDTGVVRISGNSGVHNLAQSWLNSLNGDTTRFAPVYALVSENTQDMLVPAPGALTLLGLGTLVATRRRR